MRRSGVRALAATVGLTLLTAQGCTTGAAVPATHAEARPTATAGAVTRSGTVRAAPSTATAESTPAQTAPAASAGGASSPQCLNHDVRVVLGDLSGAGGHDGYLLLFTDVSGHRCFLRGYPGVTLVSNDGTVIMDATRTLTGYLGGAAGMTGPPKVTLENGQTVAAVVEWDEAYAGNIPRPAGCYSDADAEFLVTPPNSTIPTTLYFPTISVMCRTVLAVHPVLAGDYWRPPEP